MTTCKKPDEGTPSFNSLDDVDLDREAGEQTRGDTAERQPGGTPGGTPIKDLPEAQVIREGLQFVAGLPIVGDVARTVLERALGGGGPSGVIARLSLELADRNKNGQLDVSVVAEFAGKEIAPLVVDLDAGDAFALFVKVMTEVRRRLGGLRRRDTAFD